MADNKVYYKITAMSEEFRKWDSGVSKRENGITGPIFNNQDFASLQIWKLRIQLATAQQLSVISTSLAKIAEKLTSV